MIGKSLREDFMDTFVGTKTVDMERSVLEQVEAPYLPIKNPDDNRKYTLVLDLDETLVHYHEVTILCHLITYVVER